MNKVIHQRKFIYIMAFIFVVLFSIGYSALSQTLNISGNTRYNKKEEVRVTGISLMITNEGGEELFSPSYTKNTTTTGVNLPNINSTVTYTVAVRNYTSEAKGVSLDITSNSNSNVTYQVLPNISTIPANSTVSFNITVKYNTSILPSTTTDTMTITYTFGKVGAMFQTGQTLNAKMKQFVNSSATYNTQDTTITNIARYTGTPSSTYLTDNYKVSVDEYVTPIYMWYDSASTTIYWYSEATNIYYNPNSRYFFAYLRAINAISCMNDISSEYTTNMSNMFDRTGQNSTVFTLDLGDKFDTGNVTTMYNMFYYTGYSSTVFTLDLGDKFDTGNVTTMYYMFYDTGRNSTVFTLDLGDNFDTSNVTTMYYMFYYTGRNSTVFTLDLGDKFDTSNVTNMQSMFNATGYSSTIYTLDLGDKFDTSNVTNMQSMFNATGYSSTIYTLDLGDKFDTSNVANMSYMFSCTGRNSTAFTLDLGDKFDTSSVTDMASMFYNFKGTTIYAPSTFVTDSVTSSTNMFNGCTNLVGGLGTVYDSSHTDAAYAHYDGGTSNPGYFSVKGAKVATIYYNSNTTSGGLTVSQSKTYCVPASGSTSCTITVPSEVTSSVGKYNSTYKGVKDTIGSMDVNGTTSVTISTDKTYYANYSKQVTNYYYNSSYTSRTLYRNEYFSSTSAMESRLSTSNTGISNYSTAVGPGSSVWTGLSTGADTTQEYTSVQAAANSNSGTLYTVYTFNVTYSKGANVSSIGSTSGSCKVTTSSTSCSVTLPSITPNSGATSVGWSTTNGATSGTAAGASYTISSNGGTLYANAIQYYTITFNGNGGTASPTSKTISKGSQIGTLPTASRTNYTFAGWYTDSTGGSQISSTTVPTGSVTYFAHWNPGGIFVDLGTGQTFNIASLAPSVSCGSLTVDNFYFTTAGEAKITGYEASDIMYFYTGFEKSYNTSNCTLTMYTRVYDDRTVKANVHAYLIKDAPLVSLGSGQSFNVTAYSGYQNATADNFFISTVAGGNIGGIRGPLNYYASSNIDRSYNASTGIFTCAHRGNYDADYNGGRLRNDDCTVYYLPK